MTRSCADSDNIAPIRRIALTRVVPANRHYSAVGFQSHSMKMTCTDGNNIAPVGYVAWAKVIYTNCNYGTVRFQANRMIGACTDGNNIAPIRYVALASFVITNRYHSSVRFQTNRMKAACTEGIAHGNHIQQIAALFFRIHRIDVFVGKSNGFPIGYVALARVISTNRHYSAIGFQTYGMIIA